MAITMEANTAVIHNEISESCYVGEIPAFVEAELARLYGHIHSSLAFFRTSKPADSISTYVAWQGGKPVTLLVFRYVNGTIDVFNEMFVMTEAEVCRFAQYIFKHFSAAGVISFKAVRSDVRRLPFPFQRHDAKENWQIDLPATPEEYTSRLGKATRENVRRYRRRLLRDHPSFEYRFDVAGEIDEQQVRDIIELSKARITAKKMRFGIDEAKVMRIVSLARKCGFVTVLRIDGQLCAGTVSYCVGSEYLAEVVAHDSRYDAYWLGALCYYMTICESISRGAKKFHMGGGRNEYKTRLLGVRVDMDRIDIYRSYWCMARNLDMVLTIAAGAVLRRVKVWLLEREKSFATQSVFRVLHALRKLRG